MEALPTLPVRAAEVLRRSHERIASSMRKCAHQGVSIVESRMFPDYSSGVAPFAPAVAQLAGHHAARHEASAHFPCNREPSERTDLRGFVRGENDSPSTK